MSNFSKQTHDNLIVYSNAFNFHAKLQHRRWLNRRSKMFTATAVPVVGRDWNKLK